MTHGSLFSGIGGFDLAAQWCGWSNLFHCEMNPFGQKILKYSWPDSVLYDDVVTGDFSPFKGKIDVISGGFPCQPYSQAGKREGKEDDRHLFPAMLKVIETVQPRWVVGENVYGLTNWNEGQVFREIHEDLEGLGYAVQSYLIPAAGVGAPHKRDRIFFMAYNESIPRVAEQKVLDIVEEDWWHDFPTQFPTINKETFTDELDDITYSKWRNESIMAYGNAVVPPLILQLFKSIEIYESVHAV